MILLLAIFCIAVINKAIVYINFIMFEGKSSMNNRRKLSAPEPTYQKTQKYSTVQSNCSRNTQNGYNQIRWQCHQQRRESRITSLLKLRKSKLEAITTQNQKIFLRINDQQPHYPVNSRISSGLGKWNHQDSQENCVPGPINLFQTPTCFISGERGIMCERGLTLDNLKSDKRQLPILKIQHSQNNYISIERNKKHRGTLFFPSNKENKLPDIYMMF